MSRRKKGERRKGLRLDPRIQELLEDASENRAALSRKQKRDRQRTKATYDLSPDVQAVIQQIARLEDTSASQVVEWLLTYAAVQYLDGDARLMEGFRIKELSRTPRFSYNMQPPEEYKVAMMRVLGMEEPPARDGVEIRGLRPK